MDSETVSKKYRPKKVRVRARGQFTIPYEFRKKIGIEEDTVLDVYNFGKVIIATPGKIAVKELTQGVQEGMGKHKVNFHELSFKICSPGDLLEEIKLV